MNSAVARTSLVNGSGRSMAARASAGVRGTSMAFAGVWLYVVCQAFQIPILAVGPSWAIWPTLSEIAFGVMLAGYLLERKQLVIVEPACRKILLGVMVAAGGTLLALLADRSYWIVARPAGDAQPAVFGMYQCYRLMQFVLVLRVAAGLPLNERRLGVMSLAADAALALAFAGIVGTYFSFLPTPALVAHLPADVSAGPWISMAGGQWPEAGTIGYNHSYTSTQILMLGGLSLALKRRANGLRDAACIFVTMGGVFLTGSRAGMAAALVFAVGMALRRPMVMLAMVVTLAFGLLTYSGLLGGWSDTIRETAERQATLQRPLDPENLSGRDDIWQESLQFMRDNPLRWIVGAGPGAVPQQGHNAHMLPLHVVMETGVIGLAVFVFIMWKILASLRAAERGAQPMVITTLALLVSSMTQETLYPVPSMGHFIGLYLCSVAMVLNIPRSRERSRR